MKTLVIVLVLVILLGFGAKWARDNFTVQVPTYTAVRQDCVA